jgi:L-ascorbate metabolism protein UlaG (beta-lactamase superfamily)
MTHDHIHWLGHASFRIEDGERQIYIDPWKISDKSPKADIVFITHAHYDHNSPDDFKAVSNARTTFVAPKDVASQIKGKVIGVEPNKSYVLDDLQILTIPAYNLGKKFHPKENNWVGYIITLSTGQKIYHSGDTDSTPEMRTVVTDIALLPCGGTYTMTGKEAGDAANVFRPTLLIPMHWGDIVGTSADAEEVRKIFKGETAIKAPEH